MDESIEDTTDPETVRADLLPAAMTYRCPECGATAKPVDLAEDELGFSMVKPEDRFVLCDCGVLLDIGWSGWLWHDPERVRPKP